MYDIDNAYKATHTVASGDSVASGNLKYDVTNETSVTDAAGNEMAAKAATDISNTAVDGTEPTISSVAASGTTLTVTMSENVYAAVAPDTADFTITGGGAPSVSTISGLQTTAASADNSFTLTLSAAPTDTITLAYTQNSSDDKRIKDTIGNAMATASSIAISGVITAPTGLDLAAADDTGTNDDNITSTATGLTITGCAKADSTVTLYKDGTAISGTITANGSTCTNGSDASGKGFTKDIDLTAQATPYAITAKAVSGGITSAASAALDITVDDTAPTLTYTIGTDGSETVGSVTYLSTGDVLSVTAAPSEYIAAAPVVQFKNDSANFGSAITATGNPFVRFTNTVAAGDAASTNDPIDFGSPTDGLKREALGSGYVYRTTRPFLSLYIGVSGTANTGVAMVGRTHTSKPTATTVSTAGTQMFNVGSRGASSTLYGGKRLTNVAADTYFWFYPTDTRTISNREITVIENPAASDIVSFSSGTLSTGDPANVDDPIDFGTVSAAGIERVALGTAYIYKTTESFRRLFIGTNARFNAAGTYYARQAATPPTTGTLGTHGTEIWSETVPFAAATTSGGKILSDVSAGTFVWFYPSGVNTLTNRILELRGTNETSSTYSFTAAHTVVSGDAVASGNLKYDITNETSVKDVAGTAMATQAVTAIANTAIDSAVPTISSVAISESGTTFTILMSESVYAPTTPDNGDFVITGGGAPTVSAISGLPTAGASADNSFTLTISAALTGAATLTYTQNSATSKHIKDVAGNKLASASAVSLPAPAINPPTALDLAAADDTATNTDNITATTTGLTITGCAKADSTVTLYKDGTAIANTVTANGTTCTNGSDSAAKLFTKDIDLTAQAAPYAITAKAVSGSDTSAPSVALNITVDTTAPTATYTTPMTGAETVGSTTYLGTGDTVSVVATMSEPVVAAPVVQFKNDTANFGSAITATKTDLIYHSAAAAGDAANTDDAIDFGAPTDGITRVAVGSGYVYKTTRAFNSLYIGVSGTANLGVAMTGKQHTSEPSAAEISTVGTQLFNVGSRGSNNLLYGGARLTDVASGTHFWFYPTTNRTISSREMTIIEDINEAEVVGFSSGTQTGSDAGGTQDPLDFGTVSAAGIEREALGSSYVYKTTESFRRLNIGANAKFNSSGGAFRARWATTKPTAATVSTHGTEMWSRSIQFSSTAFSGGKILHDIPSGTYFWFYPSATKTATERLLELRGTNAIVRNPVYTATHTVAADESVATGDLKYDITNETSVKDVAGTAMATQAVTDIANTVIDGAVPTISSISASGTTLTVTMSESVYAATAPDNGDFVITGGGAPSVSGISGLQTAAASADNSFTLTIASALTAGTPTLAYTQNASATKRIKDAAGNAVASASSVTITVLTAPSGLDLATADDTGAHNDDNITKNTSDLTITGCAKADSTVTLYKDGTAISGTATASGSTCTNGSDTGTAKIFTKDIDLTAQAAPYAITAQAVSGSMTSSVSEALNITVDTTAPTATYTTPTTGSVTVGSTAYLDTGDTVSVVMTMDEAIDGTPTVQFKNDSANFGSAITASGASLVYSNAVAAGDSAGTQDAIDFGAPSSGITRVAVGSGYVYKTTRAFNSLYVGVSGTANLGVAMTGKQHTSEPSASEISTAGTQLFNVGSRGANNLLYGGTLLTDVASGTHFWFYPTDTRTISNREITIVEDITAAEVMTYSSGEIAAADTAGTADPIDFGTVSASGVERQALGSGFIYKTTDDFRRLYIGADAEYTATGTVSARYAATAPETTTLTTHGTALWSRTIPYVNGTASGGALLADVPSDTYFWFYPSVANTVTDRLLELRGTKDFINNPIFTAAHTVAADESVTSGNLKYDVTNETSVKDLAGNALAAKAVTTITGTVIDGAVPTISSVAASGTTLTVTMSENVYAATSPDNGDFVITGGGAPSVSGISGLQTAAASADNSFTLTIASALTGAATLAYTQNASATKRIKDVAGNATATASSISISGSSIKAVSISAVSTDDYINATEDDSAILIAGTSIDLANNTTITITLDDADADTNADHTFTATTNSTGAWTTANTDLTAARIQALDEGAMTITASADGATDGTRTVVYDATAPTATVASVSGGYVDAAEDDSAVSVYTTGSEELSGVTYSITDGTDTKTPTGKRSGVYSEKLDNAMSAITLADSDYFGSRVARDGVWLAVSAYQDDTGGTNFGTVYLIKDGDNDGDWSDATSNDVVEINNSTAGISLSSGDYFGFGLDLDNGTVAVGVTGEDTGGSNYGAVFLIDDGGDDWASIQASDVVTINNDTTGITLASQRLLRYLSCP